MKRIGLTGGIGAGKTTVSKIFQIIGIPIYSSDEVAKKILKKNDSVKQQMMKHFGKGILTNNNIDNKKIANVIFKKKDKLKIVNSIIHPLVKKDFESWCKKQNNIYIIKESALLFTSNAYKELDYIILIKSPLELRIKRIKSRDQKNEKEIFSIIKNQSSDDFLDKHCDYIIKNDENSFLIEQVLKLNEIFIK
jgi:dephospho-CoA kinase